MKKTFGVRKVKKRDGRFEDIDFNKILIRISGLCHGLSKHVFPDVVAQHVIRGIGTTEISTQELDEHAIEIAADMADKVPDYSILSGRIACSNVHKNTPQKFSEAMDILYNYHQPKTKKHCPKISKEVWEFSQKNADELNAIIDNSKDDNFTIHGIQTLKRSYLLKCDGKIIERPQYMWLRVSIGIRGDNLESVKRLYQILSTNKAIFSSPVLFNAGTPHPQLASCFLIDIEDDSIAGIYNTQKDCALISKRAGGVGITVNKIRGNGSYIAGTDGHSEGIIKMLRVTEKTFEYVNQGNKRQGSCAIYLSPDHCDFLDFLEIKNPGGAEEKRARNLLTAVWLPDLFMRRVKQGKTWSFFSPDIAPGLDNVYDEEFDKDGSYTKLYESYEEQGLAVSTMPALDVWYAILDAQLKSGTPYLVAKDQCNRMSNQKNIGVIKSSNLCAEIVEVSSPYETAVCNLASINLSAYVDEDTKQIDYNQIVFMSGEMIENLNLVIDRSMYPTDKCRLSNTRHRPLGLGVSGLQDVFFKLQLPFDSPEASLINRRIFESIYYGAVLKSVELAARDGFYETFKGSPASQGIFNFEMYNVKPDSFLNFDWETLRKRMMSIGLRNSLLIALMPTASSAGIMNVTECFEPQTSNMYTRNVLSGEFIVSNKYLAKDLDEINLWNEDIINQILVDGGSVRNIETSNPDNKKRLEEIKAIYKTVWEQSMQTIINMAVDRQAFVDQSQSLNLFKSKPEMDQLSSMYFYGWEKGLKTIVYYLRMQSASDAQQFTVDQTCLSCQS